MRIHTSHLSLGKQIPRGCGVMFLDVTRKSGGPFAQHYLAPSWDLLHSYKRKELTTEEYAIAYLDQLTSHGATLVSALKEILAKFTPTDVILGCYCGSGEFCHRHLLKRWLIDQLQLEAGWELQSANLYQGDEPVSSIISVAAPKEVREDLLKYLCVEFGSHIIVGVDADQATGDSVQDMQLENDLSVQLLKKAQTQLVRRQGPLIDLTEFGTLNAQRNTYSDTIAQVSLGYPTKVDYPWSVVKGDYTSCLAYLRGQRFAPTFEITQPAPNPDFEQEMDRLYHYGLMSLRDTSDD